MSRPIEHVLTHADDAEASFTSVLRSKPKFVALVRAIAEEVQEAEHAAFAVHHTMRIDTAIGAQLDMIGRIVGEPRDGRSDDVYRVFLRGRVAANRSRGRPSDIQAVLEAVAPECVWRVLRLHREGIYAEYEIHATTVAFGADEGVISGDAVAELVRDATGEGVRVQVLWSDVAEPYTLSSELDDYENSDTLGLGADSPTGISGWASEHIASETLTSGVYDSGSAVGLVSGTSLYARSVAHGSWSETPYGGGSTNLKDVTAGGSNEFVMIGADDAPSVVILRSDDLGGTFSPPSTDLSAVPADNAVVQLVAYANEIGNRAHVALVHDGDTTCTALQSTDGGDNWTTSAGPDIDGGGLFRLWCDPLTYRFFALLGAGESHSDDVGGTWSTTTPLPGTGATFATAIARLGSALFAVGVNNYGVTNEQCVWRSDDDGDSWTLLTITGLSGYVGFMLDLIEVNGILVGAMASGTPGQSNIYLSEDGETWTAGPDSIDLGVGAGSLKLTRGNNRVVLVIGDQIWSSSPLTGGGAAGGYLSSVSNGGPDRG